MATQKLEDIKVFISKCHDEFAARKNEFFQAKNLPNNVAIMSYDQATIALDFILKEAGIFNSSFTLAFSEPCSRESRGAMQDLFILKENLLLKINSEKNQGYNADLLLALKKDSVAQLESPQSPMSDGSHHHTILITPTSQSDEKVSAYEKNNSPFTKSPLLQPVFHPRPLFSHSTLIMSFTLFLGYALALLSISLLLTLIGAIIILGSEGVSTSVIFFSVVGILITGFASYFFLGFVASCSISTIRKMLPDKSTRINTQDFTTYKRVMTLLACSTTPLQVGCFLLLLAVPCIGLPVFLILFFEARVDLHAQLYFTACSASKKHRNYTNEQ